jgi:hypothetical protein
MAAPGEDRARQRPIPRLDKPSTPTYGRPTRESRSLGGQHPAWINHPPRPMAAPGLRGRGSRSSGGQYPAWISHPPRPMAAPGLRGRGSRSLGGQYPARIIHPPRPMAAPGLRGRGSRSSGGQYPAWINHPPRPMAAPSEDRARQRPVPRLDNPSTPTYGRPGPSGRGSCPSALRSRGRGATIPREMPCLLAF